MASHTLPPVNYSGQLSRRAVQMLRDLKGLSLLDGNVPTLSESVPLPSRDKSSRTSEVNNTASTSQSVVLDDLRIDPELRTENPIPTATNVTKGKGEDKKNGFSRENYLKEVRESLLGSLVLSILGFLIVVAGLYYLGKELLLPEFLQVKQKQSVLSNVPLALKTIEAQLTLQHQKLDSIVEQNNQLTNSFPNAHEIEETYVDFLNLLESQKVSVATHYSSVTQSTDNPLYAAFKASGDAKKYIETNAPKTKTVNLSGAVTTGLNYYHVEMTMKGSYVGYLSARQALVNANPNLIVHAENIYASTTTPGQMDMVVFASLPFLSQP